MTLTGIFKSLIPFSNNREKESVVAQGQVPPRSLFRFMADSWSEIHGTDARNLVSEGDYTVTLIDTPMAALLNLARYDGLLVPEELRSIRSIAQMLNTASESNVHAISNEYPDLEVAKEVSHHRRIEVVESNEG